MGSLYHDGQRRLQDRFDTRRLADRLEDGAAERIGDVQRAFIEARDMFFLATADAEGRPQCSYKGGDPGFVRVLDDRSIAFPSYDGNGMFLSAGNIAVNPHVGILFVDFEGGSRLRLDGEASIDLDDPLLDTFPGAVLVVRVRVTSLFANCRRYVHRYLHEERSPFVPTASTDPPTPDWKLDPWFEGSLPSGDTALDPTHPVAPATPEI